MFSASFVNLVVGFETVSVTLASGSRMGRLSTVEAEHFLALLFVTASASAFESFENATAVGSMIVHFAVRASDFFIVVFVSAAVSADISLCTASCISSSSVLAMSSAVTV